MNGFERPSTMEGQKTENENSSTGYLHNASPVLTSNKTKFIWHTNPNW